jgi:ankyrin repeat protein
MGRTVLHDAAGDRECTKLLLEHGAQVNVVDKDGVSALLLNAKLDSLPCIELLVENGNLATLSNRLIQFRRTSRSY